MSVDQWYIYFMLIAVGTTVVPHQSVFTGMKDFEQDKNATCCKNIGKYRSSQSLFRTDQKVAYK